MARSQSAMRRPAVLGRRIACLLFAVLALLSFILVLYLGSHSRLIGDDFCHLVSGQAYGPWGNLLFWRNSYNGSYSFYFLQGLSGPLDTRAPGLFIVITVAALLIGFVWLILAGHRLLGLVRPPLAQVILVVAALVWLAIDGLPSALGIYFYTVLSRHTLPIAILAIALAACCEVAHRVRSARKLAAACLIFALLAFVNAGMAEIFAFIQLALLTTLLPAVYVMIPETARRNSIALSIFGWAATVSGLLVMLTAPGAARRMAIYDARGLPLRSFGEMLPQFLESSLTFIADSQYLVGLIGMLALCLFLMLFFPRPATSTPVRKPMQLYLPPLLLCVHVQLLLIPLVWSHQSDNPLVFGRFSPAYAVVVVSHTLLVLCLVGILLAQRNINSRLLKRPEYWIAIPVLTLAFVFALFSLTQFRSVDSRVQRYGFCSIFILLLALLWQFHFHFRGTRNNRFPATAIWVSLVMCMSALIPVAINLVINNGLYLYTLSFVSFAFSIVGFICGISIAYAINLANAETAAIPQTRMLAYGSAIIAIVIWASTLLGNARNISKFEQFSQAWNERHQLILSSRESGELLAEVPPLLTGSPKALGYDSRPFYYWETYCASDEITALLEEKYRA